MVKAAIDERPKDIIVSCESVDTDQQIAKLRPGMPITVLTLRSTTARHCYGWLEGALQNLCLKLIDRRGCTGTIDEFKAASLIFDGEAAAIVHGYTVDNGATNTMKIEYT